MTDNRASVEENISGDTGEGPDTSRYVHYLITNRNFIAPAVSAAIRAIDLNGRGALRILDAGTGAGGALTGLLDLLDPGQGTITAIDTDSRAVGLAARSTDDRRVRALQADLREVAAAPADCGGPFDLIWASDVVWPATFDDPGQVVAELAGALTPGGVLALFTTNYYQSMFLPGHSRLERLIRTASEITWGIPADGPTHYERLGAWMRQAGLREVTMSVFPITAASTQQQARPYLEQIVWPEMLHAIDANGRAAGMTDVDMTRARQLLTPESPDWIGADPDGFVVHPTLLWTGLAETGKEVPSSGRE